MISDDEGIASMFSGQIGKEAQFKGFDFNWEMRVFDFESERKNDHIPEFEIRIMPKYRFEYFFSEFYGKR
jgi:hypothetical protein